MRKSKFNQDDFVKIENLYKAGVFTEEIAKTMGCSRRHVEKIVKKRGLWMPKSTRLKGFKKFFSKSEYEEICKLNNLGMNYREISEITNLPYSRVKKAGLEMGLSSNFKPEEYRKYQLDENWLDLINSPEKAIYLGLFFADGYNAKSSLISLLLEKTDKEYLDRLCKFFHERDLYEAKGGKYVVSAFRSKKWTENLNRYGAINNKSLILKWPNFLPESMDKYFIRGFFEGDGCVYKCNKREPLSRCFIQVTSTKEFLKTMSEKLKFHLNIESFIYKCRNYNEKNTYSLNIRKQSSVAEFCRWIYSDETHLAMERKYKICQCFLENRFPNGKIILYNKEGG